MSQAAQSPRPAAASASTAASAGRATRAVGGAQTAGAGRPPPADVARPTAAASPPAAAAASPAEPEQQRDAEQARGLLPYGNSGKWAAHELLANLTQWDADGRTSTDTMRCTAVTVLGSHIVEGPHSVATLALQTISTAESILKAGVLAQENPALAANLRELLPYMRSVPKRLLTRAGTYKDLNRLAHMVKACAVWKESEGTNEEGVRRMNGTGAGVHSYTGQIVYGYDGVRRVVERLGDFGMQTTLGVTTEEADGTLSGHSVLAGCDKAKGPWLHNPWPIHGSQLLYFSKDAKKLRKYLGEKSPVLVQAIHAHTAFG